MVRVSGVVVLVGSLAVVEIDCHARCEGRRVTELDKWNLRAVFALGLGGSAFLAYLALSGHFEGFLDSVFFQFFAN